MRVLKTSLIVHQGRTFFKHVIPAIMKPLRTLWNEVIGFLFLSFAVIFGFKTAGYVRQYLNAGPAAGPGQAIRLAMAAFCTAVLAWYGISSFYRARKISRS